MSLLDRLERRLGFIAIPGLPRILVGFAALVFALAWLLPGFTSMLTLDPARIRHGEVWRLITYIFIPQSLSPLWVLFALWFLWWIGAGLERAWGAFRLTLYFLVGMIGTTAAAFFFGSNFSNGMLIASLFFAFARFYPEAIIYAFWVLPVKVKWMAWLSAAGIVIGLLGGSWEYRAAVLVVGFVVNPMSYRMALVAAFANYLIFFGPQFIFEARHRHEVSTRRKRFEVRSRDEAEPLHRCAVCHATELTDPNLDFRVARDGEEYCVAHLPKVESPAR